jgi:hypothetical protein
VLQGITNAREQFNKENLIGEAECAFLKYYRELAIAADPVTVASLRDSTEEKDTQEKDPWWRALPWWLWWLPSGRTVKCIPASVACYTHWAFAAIGTLFMQ